MPREPVQIGRRFLPWLFVAILAGLSRTLRRSHNPSSSPAPGVVATRPAPAPTPRPQPTATIQPARLSLAVFRRNGRVVFRGSGFSAQILDGVLHLGVLRSGGYGRIDFGHPPVAGPFVYTLEARRFLGNGELLATLTDPETRITWNFAFNSAARTWGVATDEQGRVGSVSIDAPRSYQDLTAGDTLRTISITRRKEGMISLSVNGIVIDDAALEDLESPLIVGVGAQMPRERIPVDATSFSVLITQAALA